MPPQTETTNQEQLALVNILRFLAAVFVMMYHYTFMFFQRGNSYLDFPLLKFFFHYGYLGVHLFFIISGFVITLSAENRKFKAFLISRITRLYPALWICAGLTFISYFIFGQQILGETKSLLQFLTNLTMVPTLFGQNIIDGSYWSLSVELKFYAFIGVLLLTGLFKFLREIAIGLSFILLPLAFVFKMEHNHISLFLSGVIFYYIYKNKSKLIDLISLLALLSVSIKYATSEAAGLIAGYKYNFSQITIAIYIISFYAIFYLISQNKLNFKNTKFIGILGAITYPVYLIHQEVGRLFFKFTEINQYSSKISLLVMVSFVLTISYLINKYYEKPVQKNLKELLKKCFN